VPGLSDPFWVGLLAKMLVTAAVVVVVTPPFVAPYEPPSEPTTAIPTITARATTTPPATDFRCTVG